MQGFLHWHGSSGPCCLQSILLTHTCTRQLFLLLHSCYLAYGIAMRAGARTHAHIPVPGLRDHSHALAVGLAGHKKQPKHKNNNGPAARDPRKREMPLWRTQNSRQQQSRARSDLDSAQSVCLPNQGVRADDGTAQCNAAWVCSDHHHHLLYSGVCRQRTKLIQDVCMQCHLLQHRVQYRHIGLVVCITQVGAAWHVGRSPWPQTGTFPCCTS
jgi:hypothetical protein